VSDIDAGPPDLAEVGRVLAEACGLSLSSGLRRTLRDGLAAAAASLHEAPACFAGRVLRRDRDAVEALVEHAVVLETCFMRHPEQIAALAQHAFRRPGPLSIWSAGCATGEEPYTIAIALLEAGRGAAGDRILATDVSERALAAARAGSYGAWSLRRLPPPVVERWFSGDRERRVVPAVRGLVDFRRHNLLAEPPPGAPFDVVLCRNVLIYFEPSVAAEVFYRLVGALRPDGLLLVGPVELPLAAAIALEWVDEGGATLLRRPASG
jgi:chemotaxis protein methyltransferase CheR